MKSSSTPTKEIMQNEKILPGRPVSASRTEMTELVLPQDSNLLGNILGGRVMHLIDIAGAIAAHRRAFHTSVEVGVEVFSEDSAAGARKHTTTAFLTFVALDEIGRPVPVQPLIVKTSEERRRFREAGERRNLRLKARKKT
jgi:acyl-CoA hydrolase